MSAILDGREQKGGRDTKNDSRCKTAFNVSYMQLEKLRMKSMSLAFEFMHQYTS